MSANSLREASSQLEEQYRREICLVGHRMYERGYIVACEGNLSIRLDADRILTTPTCMNKGMMSPDDLIIIDMEGHHLQGDRKVSSEAGMHLLFYRMRPDVHAVCHGHPATAAGFAAAGQGRDQALFLELVGTLGKVPLVCYATPGTPDLGTDLEPNVPHHDAFLLANHGVVTCGPDLVTALTRLEILEHFAKTVLNTRLVGESRSFSTRGVTKRVPAHLRYQSVSPPSGGTELPETGENPDNASDEVTLTRAELDALLDAAVRKDRAHR